MCVKKSNGFLFSIQLVLHEWQQQQKLDCQLLPDLQNNVLCDCQEWGGMMNVKLLFFYGSPLRITFFLKRLVLSFLFQTIRIDARFHLFYQHSIGTAMQYFHILKLLGFLSCWTLLCWFFFAGEKNISDQVKVLTISHIKTVNLARCRWFQRKFWSDKNWVYDKEWFWKLTKVEDWMRPSLCHWSKLLCPMFQFNFGRRTRRNSGFQKAPVAGDIVIT